MLKHVCQLHEVMDECVKSCWLQHYWNLRRKITLLFIVCSFIRNNAGLWFYYVSLFVCVCVCVCVRERERERAWAWLDMVHVYMHPWIYPIICADVYGFVCTSARVCIEGILMKFINLCKILHVPMDGESKQKWKWEDVVLTVGVCVGR